MALVYFSGRGYWADLDPPGSFFDFEKLGYLNDFYGLFLLEDGDAFKLKHEGKVRVTQLRYSGQEVFPYSPGKSGIDESYKLQRYRLLIRSNDVDFPGESDGTTYSLDDIIQEENQEEPKSDSQLYLSNNLVTLNKAAFQFWSTADPEDKNTHPTNEEVSNWLKQRGFSDISAKQGAVIIRPEWAANGRRPTK